MSMDLDRVRTAALNAREAMQIMEAEPWRNASSVFPALRCEHASIAVAEVLANRDLGSWRVATAGEAELPSRHTWRNRQDEPASEMGRVKCQRVSGIGPPDSVSAKHRHSLITSAGARYLPRR